MKEFLKKILRIINKQISKVSNPLTIPDIGYRTKNTKVRIAVIGLGNQGSKLCHYLCKMGYNVVAICDFSRRKGYRIKKKFPSIKFVKNIENLSKYNIDICVVATLATGRLSIIQQLNNIGIKKILVEKPITNNISDSHLLKNYVKNNNIHIEVYHPFLFSQDAKVFKSEIDRLNKGRFIKANLVFKPSGLGNIGSHVLSSFMYLTNIKITDVVCCSLFDNNRKSRGKNFNDPNAIITFATKENALVYLDNSSNDLLETNLFIEYENLYVNLYNSDKMVVLFKNLKDNNIMILAKSSINNYSGRYKAIDQGISLLNNNKSHSLQIALDAIEIILASHISYKKSRSIALPLDNEAKMFYNFS